MSNSGKTSPFKAIYSTELWSRCDLLRCAISDWCQLLVDSEVDAPEALGSASLREFLSNFSKLEQWILAGLITHADIDAAAATAGGQVWLEGGGNAGEFIDRFLVPELLLGLSRFGRSGHKLPAHFRDSLAAVTAVEAQRALIDATLQPEDFDHGVGCWLRPSLIVPLIGGRFLADRIGESSAIEAAAGQAPIGDAIDADDRREFETLLTGRHDARALAAAQPGGLAEVQAVWCEDALLAHVQRRVRQAGLARAVIAPPHGGRLQIDFADARLHAVEPPPSIAQMAAMGWIDPPVGALPLPAAPCKLAQQRGWASATLVIDHADELDDLVAAVLEAIDDPPKRRDAAELAGDGFAMRWNAA